MSAFVRRRQRVTMIVAFLTVLSMLALGYGSLLPLAAVTVNLGLSRDWIALGSGSGTRAASPGAMQGGVILGSAFLAHDLVGGATAVGVGYGISLLISLSVNRLPPEAGREQRSGPDAWILLAYLAVQVTSTMDAPLLGALEGSTAAGIYGAIYRLPNAWIALLAAVIGGMVPSFTRAEEQGRAAVLQLRRRTLLLSSAGSVLILASAPVGYLAVPIVFGQDYAAGQWPVVILLVANAVITISAPLHVLAIARGDDRPYAMAVGTGATLNLGLNLILISRFGIAGAALSTLIAQSAIALLLRDADRRFGKRAVGVSSSSGPGDVDSGR